MKPNYRKTLKACYLGFITQAIAANFAPLLFLRFHAEYGIPLGQIALISTVFYLTQLIVDVICAKFVDQIGYRNAWLYQRCFRSSVWPALHSSLSCAAIRLPGSLYVSPSMPLAAA